MHPSAQLPPSIDSQDAFAYRGRSYRLTGRIATNRSTGLRIVEFESGSGNRIWVTRAGEVFECQRLPMIGRPWVLETVARR